MTQAFHLAVPVDDLEQARAFYAGLLGCRVGREDSRWIDFDFFGHQLTVHQVDTLEAAVPVNVVDDKRIPVRHFGMVLGWQTWEALAARLRAAGTAFLVEPGVRFAGRVGEQATLFIQDPAGNALEFKAFRDPAQLFARAAR